MSCHLSCHLRAHVILIPPLNFARVETDYEQTMCVVDTETAHSGRGHTSHTPPRFRAPYLDRSITRACYENNNKTTTKQQQTTIPMVTHYFFLLSLVFFCLLFSVLFSTDLTDQMRNKPLKNIHVSTALHPMTQEKEVKSINVILSKWGHKKKRIKL